VNVRIDMDGMVMRLKGGLVYAVWGMVMGNGWEIYGWGLSAIRKWLEAMERLN